MTHYCLVRHGQTDWNVIGRYQGQSNVPLNDIGLAQAAAVAENLAQLDQPFSALYSSDLKRTLQTAEAIAAKVNLPIQADTRLREINQGEWEGQLVTVIRERYSQLWQQRETDPANLRPPGGETVAEVAARVHAALDDIAARHPHQRILIVSHGLAIATARCHVEGLPLGRAYERIPENTGVVWVEWVSI